MLGIGLKRSPVIDQSSMLIKVDRTFIYRGGFTKGMVKICPLCCKQTHDMLTIGDMETKKNFSNSPWTGSEYDGIQILLI